VRRLIGLAAAVLVATLVAFMLLRAGDDEALVAEVEGRLAAGDVQGASALVGRARARLPGTLDYLSGAIELASGHDRAATVPLERALAARPEEWRIVSALASAAANAGDFARAHAVVDGYAARHPEDERALALSAQLSLDGRDRRGRNPRVALEALDRIAKLPSRVAPPGDRTAVRDELLARLRIRADAELGKAQDALGGARAAAKARPQDAGAWYDLGDAARQAGYANESVAAYRKAVDLDPANRRFAEQLVMTLLEFSGPVPELLERTEKLLAMAPDDPALLVLRARAFARDDKGDGHVDDADGIYRKLEARSDLPPELRLQVFRNHAVLLYDWKAGARGAEYLDESYALLRKYKELGGPIDEELRAVWEDLEEREKKPK
jgi:tetratricopeptide (TPR) repeat protein